MRPKDIGTKAESAVVRYLTDHGFPHAERRALRGINDVGDITGTPGIVWEVKGGEAARTASDNQIERWLGETEVERRNAREHIGILVIARSLKNVRDWWACCWADQLTWLITKDSSSQLDYARTIPIRITLAHMVPLLRAAGFGEPLEDEQELQP